MGDSLFIPGIVKLYESPGRAGGLLIFINPDVFALAVVVVLKGWVKSWVKGWVKDRIQKKLGKSWVKSLFDKFKKRQNKKGTKLNA